MNNSLPPNTNTAPTEPIQLGHYELLDCIGRGGMGLVYRARDTRLDRQVAIKCLRTELFEHHYVERFKREALLLAKLNHPNIVQIYDFIEAPDQLALVMELVEGQNLQLHLREHIVPFAQRMRWLTEIAQGLAVAHDAGIIHRDLKAENILINQRKVAKITDLGIAKSQHFNATLTDHVAGSYCSMSPEQAMGEAIDFKSDLFSFGILAYQLLCGAHPFGDTNNKLQLMQRIISHPPTAPGKHNPNLPAEINDLLGQLLSKDPTKRPDNTHWVAAQFEKLSHLQLTNDFVSDDTQAIIPNGSAANQSNVKSSGINSAVRTQDHPTFETRFIAVNTAPKKSPWLPIKNYLIENKISVSFGLFSVLILAAVVTWQLQPRPPKYVAVIPPKLTAEGMQESQQELVKGAVYDAIQQSVIQLDGYYLIPRDEIADVNGDNETVRMATAADELITTEIQCKLEACTITLSRLVQESKKTNGRLRVEDTKTVDLLTDNYLSANEIIQNNISNLYKSTLAKKNTMSNKDYASYIHIIQALRNNGASIDLLERLEKITENHQNNNTIDTLYKDISLELYHETQNPLFLEKLERQLNKNTNIKQEKIGLYNIYYLQVAKSHFDGALDTIKQIEYLGASSSSINELFAYLMMAKHNYQEAIKYYTRAVHTKKTANNLYNIAIAYWLSGDNEAAKLYLTESLAISPDYYKSHSLFGSILMYEGDIDNAIIYFSHISIKNTKDIINYNNLGLCYLIKKEYQMAKKSFLDAMTLDKNNTAILLNYADTLNLAGQEDNAKVYYTKVVDLSQKSEKKQATLKDAAQAFAHMKEDSKALETLQLLERDAPQNVDTFYTAALVHTLTNNISAAIFNVERSLENGMHAVWFDFSWFDQLCNNKKFITVMQKYGEPDRCSP